MDLSDDEIAKGIAHSDKLIASAMANADKKKPENEWTVFGSDECPGEVSNYVRCGDCGSTEYQPLEIEGKDFCLKSAGCGRYWEIAKKRIIDL